MNFVKKFTIISELFTSLLKRARVHDLLVQRVVACEIMPHLQDQMQGDKHEQTAQKEHPENVLHKRPSPVILKPKSANLKLRFWIMKF